MSASAVRYPSYHRSKPLRETVALRCKILIYCSPPQRETQSIRFDSAYMDDVIVRPIGLIVMSIGSVITQIPIDRRLH
jgi:hypothetical protein